jgi:hypothetical protein
MQELQEEGVQRAEGTSQLQDWNMERKKTSLCKLTFTQVVQIQKV